MRIVSNTIVYNEENFVWYALMSIAPYVDKMLVWDTGSTDKTAEIIKEFKKQYKEKVVFKQLGFVDRFKFTKVRQQMLDQSDGDWVLILDGDEVWWKESIKTLVKTIQDKGLFLDSITVPFYNAVGDIYHVQDENAGRYKILDKEGHLTIRAFNKKIPGVHVVNPYGSEGFFDGDNCPIQSRDSKRQLYLDSPFFHLTHLRRSSKNQKVNKYKYDLGKSLPEKMNIPEVFKINAPSLVPSPLIKRSKTYKLISTFLWPLQVVKRSI